MTHRTSFRSRVSRLADALFQSNVPGVVGGGGILASITAKHLVSPEYEMSGAAVGLLLALIFIVRVNLKEARVQEVK